MDTAIGASMGGQLDPRSLLRIEPSYQTHVFLLFLSPNGRFTILSSNGHACHTLHVIVIVNIRFVVLVADATSSRTCQAMVEDAFVVACASIDRGRGVGYQVITHVGEGALHTERCRALKRWDAVVTLPAW